MQASHTLEDSSWPFGIQPSQLTAVYKQQPWNKSGILSLITVRFTDKHEAKQRLGVK